MDTIVSTEFIKNKKNRSIDSLVIVLQHNPDLFSNLRNISTICKDTYNNDTITNMVANRRSKNCSFPLHGEKRPIIAELLIKRGADVNARNNYMNTPLHHVKTLSIAELLIKHGADVNARNNYMNTPLHLAKTNDIAKLLIKNGADLNAKNRKMNRPLYVYENWSLYFLLLLTIFLFIIFR
jgi:ankyrin repeat protein